MGHIREEDGHLDYRAFFEEGMEAGLSDEDWRKAIGNRTWAVMHGLVDHYPCEQCGEAGRTLVSGIHDMVNIHLGKPVYDADRWEIFLGMVDEARKRAKEAQHYRHETVSDRDEFHPESLEVVEEGEHLMVAGCPVEHYEGGTCAVELQPQAILHPVGHGR